MSARRHVAIRTCVGCGERGARADFVRITGGAEGHLRVDLTMTKPGRGGYLHQRRECWERFARHKGRIRSLRAVFDVRDRTALVDELGRALGR